MADRIDFDNMTREEQDRLTLELDERASLPKMLPLIDLTDWLHGDPPPRQSLWGNLLPIHQTTMLTGEGGVGKSLLAQMLCTCTVLGLPFLGLTTRQRPACYITAEDDPDELWRRQSDICRLLGVGIESVVGKLHLVSLCGDPDTALASFDANGTMTITDRWRQVEATVWAKGVGLAAFDNATDLLAGDHNALDQVAAFIRLLTGLAIEADGVSLLLHHPNKGGDDWLGSVAYHNKVRSRLIMKFGDPDGDRDLRLIENPKSNYAASGGSINFRWFKGAYVRDEDLPPSLAEQLAATAAATAANAAFLRCLAAATANKRAVSHSPSANYFGKVFSQMPEARGIKQKAFEQAFERLLHLGEIELDARLWRGEDRHWKTGIRVRETLRETVRETGAGNCGEPLAGNCGGDTPTPLKGGSGRGPLEAAAPLPEAGQ